MVVFAPNVTSYASASSYVTAAEYSASPTGVNVSQLVPRGTLQQNTDALNIVIARASSFADMFCKQILSATVDVESGRYRIQRGGQLRVPLRNTPVIAVNSISVGFAPSAMAVLPDLSNVWIDRKVLLFPLGAAPLLPTANALSPDGKIFVIVNYVNGYANASTMAPVTVGATTVTLSSTAGIAPGLQLTVFDPGNTETLFVTSIVGNTVTFTSGFQFAHVAGSNISAFPDAIKQAVILITSALIKTRGSEAIVMAQMKTMPSQTSPIDSGGFQEITLAKEMLRPFVRSM